jgi:hypothetical protein
MVLPPPFWTCDHDNSILFSSFFSSVCASNPVLSTRDRCEGMFMHEDSRRFIVGCAARCLRRQVPTRCLQVVASGVDLLALVNERLFEATGITDRVRTSGRCSEDAPAPGGCGGLLGGVVGSCSVGAHGRYVSTLCTLGLQIMVLRPNTLGAFQASCAQIVTKL